MTSFQKILIGGGKITGESHFLHKYVSEDTMKGVLIYLITPWSRVLLEKVTSELCS
jgi:hypothetical protein